ncbi:hypothetical protein MGN70_000407 [Eutypa lata]|nr:hypothetical protein MGN70_000407 [Eutypa lata]
MAPSQPDAQNNPAAVAEGGQAPQSQQSIQMQPIASKPMDPQRPHEEPTVGLRGGDRGGCCPGRFCFIIPCPLPCDCCVIPL